MVRKDDPRRTPGCEWLRKDDLRRNPKMRKVRTNAVELC
jgi:hypothetical protein